MTNDLDALEAAARAAEVPGPGGLERFTAFLATFSPSRILALTAEIRGLREALARYDEMKASVKDVSRAALAQGER